MGRPSKLTDKQWAEIQQRLLAGEKSRPLGREFGVSDVAINKRFGSQNKQIKTVANQILAAEQNLKALPASSQITAVSLANKLRAASMYLADSAISGARTGAHLKAVAGFHAEMVTRTNAGADEGQKMQRVIAGLTQVANESEKTALNLLAANKEAVKERDTERVIRVVNSPDD
jgi:hypothetical protein